MFLPVYMCISLYLKGPDFNEEQYVAEVANELLWGLEGLVEED